MRDDDDEAVSPVIGVLLLVAIVVVLSASVFLMINILADKDPVRSPEVSMLADADKGQVKFVKSYWGEGDLVWEDLDVTGCNVTGLTGVVQPGTILSCSGYVSFVHTPTSTIIWEYDFN